MAKEAINRVKKELIEWKKYFTLYIYKGLVIIIIQEQTNLKLVIDLGRYFSKKDTELANKNMEKCLISLIVRKM